MPLIWTGFIMGLAGSMHCILMCGPLASAMHGGAPGKGGLWLRNMVYQGGRITAYLVIGLIFGAIGQIVSVFFYQQVLSVVSGAALLIWALLYVFQRASKFSSRVVKLWSAVFSGLIRVWHKQKSVFSVFGLGMLNGFLPCGMVYLAATASLNASNTGYSMIYMSLFGLGTLPAMSGIILSRNLLPAKWRFSLRKLSPVFLSLLGLLFIIRGLDLNIPYLSPHISQDASGISIQSCGGKPVR